MSESSLPPFWSTRVRLFLKSLRPSLPAWTPGRLYRWARHGQRAGERDAALEHRAARAVEDYLDTHAQILERVARLEEKAERLERAGTPSESARNRAERAREEVVSGLVALRISFIEAVGEPAGARAFDRAAEKLYPASVPHGR